MSNFSVLKVQNVTFSDRGRSIDMRTWVKEEESPLVKFQYVYKKTKKRGIKICGINMTIDL